MTAPAGATAAPFSMTDFPSGARVVDVGCGEGRHLVELRERGCRAVGVEPHLPTAAAARARGFDVVAASAERLPLADRSCDGVVCSVALPYTDERAAIAEWARVLVPGGTVRASYHAFGFVAGHVLKGPGLKRRFYGARTLVNTAAYRLTGRRLPGWIGDTVYQSRRRLEGYYREFGLELVEATTQQRFLGGPVFLLHRLRKR